MTEQQRFIYNRYVQEPVPVRPVPTIPGERGTGLRSAYYRGYWDGRHNAPYARTSLAYAAWKAGYDKRPGHE